MSQSRNDGFQLNKTVQVFRAISEDKIDVLANLLKEDPNLLNVTDRLNQTPLVAAIRQGRLPMVQLLMAKNAQTDIKCNDLYKIYMGYLAIHWAVEVASFEISECLINHGVRTDMLLQQYIPLLHHAARHDNVQVIKLLLDKGLSQLNLKDKAGQTALFWAASNGKNQVVEFLLDRGADSKARAFSPNYSENGKNALYMAAQEGHLDTVRLMIAKGVNKDDRCSGNHILHAATLHNHLPVVTFLVDTWPELLEIKDPCNRTPLELALQKGHKAICKLLLEKKSQTGADVTKLHGSTVPLIFTALDTDDTELFALFVKHQNISQLIYNDEFHPIHLAAKRGKIKIIEWLLHKNPELLDVTDASGLTPLICAVGNSQFDAVDLLVSKGANVHLKFRDKSRWTTALDIAKKRNYYLVVNVLILKLFFPNQKEELLSHLYNEHQILDILQREPSLLHDMLRNPRIIGLLDESDYAISDESHFLHYKPKGRRSSIFTCLQRDGLKISFFKPERVLGKGTFGSVRLFTDQTNNKIAVKTKLQVDDEEEVDQERQAIKYELEKKCNQLAYPDSWPHALYHMGFESNQGYTNRYVMPFVPGDTAWVLFPKITCEKQLGRIVLHILIELDRIHKVGVLHGDLNPANIILHLTDDKIAVRFVDFGYAYLMEDSFAPERQLNQIKWFPPEHANTSTRIKPDPSQDIYQLAFILEVLFSSHNLAYKLFDLCPSIPRFIQEGQHNDPARRPSLQSIIPEIEAELAPTPCLVME